MQPPSKRILRPTASQPTTAEHYGRQHGIPDDIQRALQNVGRKGRMAVSQGRVLDRTQSVPSTFHNHPPGSFATSQEIIQHATNAIAHDTKSRELRPYHETISSNDPVSYPTSSPPSELLSFDIPPESSTTHSHSNSSPQSPRSNRSARFGRNAKKRKEDDGSETETSDIEDDQDQSFAQEHVISTAAPDLSWTSTSGTSTPYNDFPAVFTSPQISQPELFAPPLPYPTAGRLVRNMPGRSLGKTVSAPVGMLGRYGRAQNIADADGDQGMEEDGFDVSEWAASENF